MKWVAPGEIQVIARRLEDYNHPTRVRARRDRVKRQRNRDRITAIANESLLDRSDATADPDFPKLLSDARARLLQEWDQWDDAERLVAAFELAARLIVENTRPGKPYLLNYAPPASRGDLSADYLHVGEARHDGLEPYDFDIRNSLIKGPEGSWLSARIISRRKIFEYEPGAATARASSGTAVVTSSELGEAERFTLLWDAALEMSRANGHAVERNWLHLMDAFWCGALAPGGLTYFYPVSPGREAVKLGRTELAGLLLNHGALDAKRVAIEDLRHWRIEDYRNQPDTFRAYFQRDPEGRIGLAVPCDELDRWHNDTNGPNDWVTSDTSPPEGGALLEDVRPAVNPKLRAAIGNAVNTLGIPGKAVPWKTFCDRVRSMCGVGPKTWGYGERSIERAVRAIEAEQDKNDK